jgi:KEOPS complex subunit Cgi121
LHPAKEKIKRLVKFYEINENEIETTGSEKLSLLVRERIVLFDIFK